MATAAKKWKDFKSDLKKKFFKVYDETMSREEIMDLCDERVSDPDWNWLINHWNSPKAEYRSIVGQQNRAKSLVPHTFGSKSHACVGYDLSQDIGRDAHRDEIFIATHIHKDGTACQEAASTINQLQEVATNNPELKDKSIQEGDLYSHVFGEKEPIERVRVVGLGPTPQDIGTPRAKSYISTRMQIAIEGHRQATKHVEVLTDCVDQLQLELNEMKQLMLAVQGSNSHYGLYSQNPTNLRHEQEFGGNEEQYNHNSKGEFASAENHDSNDDGAIGARRQVPAQRISAQSNYTTALGGKPSPHHDLEIKARVDVILYDILTSSPIAKATIVSTHPYSMVGQVPLGKNYCEVVIDIMIKRNAVLPRPYDIETMGEAHMMCIAWPYVKATIKGARRGGGNQDDLFCFGDLDTPTRTLLHLSYVIIAMYLKNLVISRLVAEIATFCLQDNQMSLF